MAQQFNDEDQQWIREAVAAGIAAHANLQAADPADDRRTPNWRDSEAGYFYPDLDISEGEGDAVTVNNDLVFRDVHLFIDKLKDAVAYRGEAMVKDRIPALLRGSVQLWYSTGIDQLMKTGL